MKKMIPAGIMNGGLVLLGLLFMAVLFTRCKKEDLVPTPNPTPTTGQGMFWTASDLGCGNITVTLGGASGSISTYYNTSIPSYGIAGAAGFSLSHRPAPPVQCR